MGLIRERWGVRWAAFAALLMLAANLGSTVAEFAGIGSALGIFGIPPQISAAVAAVVVVAFIALGSYSRVQYLFVGVGLFVSLAYVISAFLAGPGLERGVPQPVRPAARRRRRSTGWRSSGRSARRSRRGARRSSSRTSPTRGSAPTTSRRAGSTSSPARC